MLLYALNFCVKIFLLMKLNYEVQKQWPRQTISFSRQKRNIKSHTRFLAFKKGDNTSCLGVSVNLKRKLGVFVNWKERTFTNRKICNKRKEKTFYQNRSCNPKRTKTHYLEDGHSWERFQLQANSHYECSLKNLNHHKFIKCERPKQTIGKARITNKSHHI